MNATTLETFRAIADTLAGPEPQDWEWIGAHMSQRMFGITQVRAENYARQFGGIARQMNNHSIENLLFDRVSHD